MFFKFLAAVPIVLGAASAASALTIDSRSNIFLANPIAGSGLNPVTTTLDAGVGRTLTFDSVTGVVNCCSGDPLRDGGPDGFQGFGTNALPTNGLSGIRAPGALFLAGVFLDGGSFGAAPATLDYTGGGISVSDAAFSPLINQTFFIGDGLTGAGSGAKQTFNIPDTATLLALGFVDINLNDNVGSLNAEFTIAEGAPVSPVPLPAPGLLLAVGIGALVTTSLRRRRASKADRSAAC